MVIRVLKGVTAFVLASGVTISLFFLMHSLIELGAVELDKGKSVRMVDFIRLKRSSNLQTKKRELPQKKQQLDQPTPPAINLPKSNSDSSGQPLVQMSAPVPSVGRSVKLAGGLRLGSGPSDAGSIPLVRINPMYPKSAADRGVEGWVTLEFTISTTGAVKNARVVDAKPPNIFNRAALQAIKKWKYKPKIVKGVPRETRGVQVRLTFQLDK